MAVPFPISGGDISITFVDASNPNCVIIVDVPDPPACSADCQVAASFNDVLCDDNGTPFGPFFMAEGR